VVDRTLSGAALRKALAKCRDRREKGMFACDAMEARGEAIRLTTLRPPSGKNRKKSGILRRILRAA